jgi:hypothetical protein
MGTREGRPEGRHPEQSAKTATDTVSAAALAPLARRWRDLGLGCPLGCPLDHHEPPCPVAVRQVA